MILWDTCITHLLSKTRLLHLVERKEEQIISCSQTLDKLAKQGSQYPSHLRERRKLMRKPCKVMKDAYFKGIQWTRTFVSSPLDSTHNRNTFLACFVKLVCIFTRKGKGRCLDITGVNTQQLRRKDCKFLTPVAFQKSSVVDIPLVTAGNRLLFYSY